MAENNQGLLRKLMTRLILGLLFTTFLLILPHSSWISAHVAAILQFILATPVVFWSAWPIWQKGWLSVRNLHLDRFTLMAIGLGLAYGYSFIALIVPEWFFSTLLMNGEVDLHFDWAAIMAVLVSFEQVMEHLAWNKAETILWNAKSSHPSQLKTNDKAAKEQLSTLNIQLSLDAAIPYFVLGVLVLAVLTFVLGLVYAPYPAISWALKSTLSVIMIAGAGMLTLVSPLAVAIGMGRGASTGIMIKNIESLETLARTDMLVIDKSSIIALDQLTVTTVLPVSIMSKDQLLYFAASLELASKHPLARAVVASAQQSQCALVNPTEFCEEKGLGVCGKIDGQFIAVGNERWIHSFKAEVSHHFVKNAEKLQRKGETVLFVLQADKIIGLISIYDPVKKFTTFALKKLQEEAIQVILATGDNCITSNVFAEELGINAVESEIGYPQKKALLKRLKQEGFVVAMVGDEISEVAAFNQDADLTILTRAGFDIDNEANLSFVQGDLLDVYRAQQLSKSLMRVVWRNIYFACIYNLIGILAAMGLLYWWTGLTFNPVVATLLMSVSLVVVIANSFSLNSLFKN